MPNTITNKKHNSIVQTLMSELRDSGLYEGITQNYKSGYDISCREKASGKEVFFAVLLFSERLYDATTLEEWELANANPDSFYFVAAVKNPEQRFYVFNPDSFLSYCSVPKFKINCALQKKDFSKYISIQTWLKQGNNHVETSRPNRRTSKQLTPSGIVHLTECWAEL